MNCSAALQVWQSSPCVACRPTVITRLEDTSAEEVQLAIAKQVTPTSCPASTAPAAQPASLAVAAQQH
jgi:hypothetical protein